MTGPQNAAKPGVLWIGGDARNVVHGATLRAALDLTQVWSTDMALRLGLSRFTVIVLAYSEPERQREAAQVLSQDPAGVPVLVLVSAADAIWIREIRASERLAALLTSRDDVEIDWAMRLLTHIRWLAAKRLSAPHREDRDGSH